MAQVIIAYQDDAGTMYGASVEQSSQELFQDFATAAGQAPVAPFNQTFASLAALQAVAGWSGAIALPAGYQPRKLTLFIGEAGGANLASLPVVVGSPAAYDALEPTGATPYPTAGFALTTMLGSIGGTAGESRSSN
jgi:hypothetical protein